ncbi:hypothetical protein [Polyangium jinanense]|uniref:Uncharacterized protein n=1 Tax=Polyangium jinanense TaxID=2829994 RepID=A0A9X4B0A4_9BACT|nr:hypothetical protein [Polyangium jinanense]MDC3962763.1 hypothetical protein [Polyangium jinanense]MDC3989270.1 hypothetical protein [Polyangium jinanense]
MNGRDDDPLLEKLRGLPAPSLAPARRAKTLDAAEAALGGKRRAGFRWPEFAVASVLALAGALYTVESFARIGHIYGRPAVAAADGTQ